MKKMIDLRSDTVTRPTPGMLAAMMAAAVGDDVYGEDPTVNALEAKAAALLGKEAALFVPSGTMGNQIAIAFHTRPGDEVVCEAMSHTYNFESGAGARLASVQFRPVQGQRGVLDPAAFKAALWPKALWLPRQSLYVLENTHNFGGGAVVPLTRVRELTAIAREHGLRRHLDGARLFNAAVASGVSAAEYASHFDTVNICLSKGLGAPVGSVVAGRTEDVAEMRRLRKMFGGGMRQAGYLAAAGIYALDHHIERLAEDHRNARRLAELLAASPALSLDVSVVETNIFFVDMTPSAKIPAAEWTRKCRERGLVIDPVGERRVRFVTHLDVNAEDMETAARIALESLG
ncbi:MAG: L-allo-threonine aldolase [Myxococcota bacterium]|nr:L-allo-threonine aldolase [Myxococcota bacterium]